MAAHKCLECDELRLSLGGKTWLEVQGDLLFEHEDCLPLLTPAAYRSFLPAWLHYALANPESTPAVMVLINMEVSEHLSVFTPYQRDVAVACVRHIHQSDPFSVQDPESIARVRTIQERWQS